MTPNIRADRAFEGAAAIAKRASRDPGLKVPIQVRAQALRQQHHLVPSGYPFGFALPATDPAASCALPDADWIDDAARRALDAAEEAGLDNYRIEIGSDGTIAIVVGEQAATD